MAFEDKLVQKTYYTTFVLEDDKRHPIGVLGDLFFAEQKKELSDLSMIRFAQGEAYYDCQDYEAAIFKWENVHNELEPWAKKNMADAYFELDLYDTAENIYQTITTDSPILNTEITLQLFGVYLAQGKYQKANQMILNAVHMNPDYPNVTKLARAFFENQEDWNHAIELATNEAIRTMSNSWFNTLHSYIEKGYTKYHDPAFFAPLLTVLAREHDSQFEKIVVELWGDFQHQNSYLPWLRVLNQEIIEAEFGVEDYSVLSTLYNGAFLDLLIGNYDFSDVENIVPLLLSAWQKVSSSVPLFVSTAILSWNDLFPETLSSAIVEKAEIDLSKVNHNENIFKESIEIFQSIRNWAEENQLEVQQGIEWILHDESTDEHERNTTLLTTIKKSISNLLEQQEQMTLELSESINVDSDILARMQGSINQMQDLEEENVLVIEKAYSNIKKEIIADLEKTIPKMIRESSEIIKEDSDFGKIHLELNREMNDRIHQYLSNTIIPIFIRSLEDWISFSQQELTKCQDQITGWAYGFNALLGEEKLTLECDFKIIEDWKRDIDRMTSSVHIEKENILLRRTPSQVILKGAGKLLGAIPKNNAILANTYKSYIQNDTYQETTNSIISKFFRQFELLENSIGRDVHIFFRSPLSVLKQTVDEMNEKVVSQRSDLAILKSNPELFRNRLSLYEVRLRQLEWINYSKRIYKESADKF
ncbi:hypothetical protein ACFFF5_10090 [Lederbergia wuyishanensis]|uniref:Tetratricopeptide (TPR) repeat protein n=1 Tax=Lederbergia wuyishanensis TaxID=1347903 RepID=A0ABU0D7F1_9BACI|nr:hypothetical protein [Lederbergia wuyishanensis]MCJ8008964.1 hypothetical protein [Lederbergia wuyishanensis]MDQ0344293.1 tetratricopeptide (TPR) repeat protein [Lederbergia wuyishanensis]